VRDVSLRHQQVVVPDAGNAAAAGSAAVYRNELSDMVSLAYLDGGRFSAVFQVLRCLAYRSKGKHVRAVSDGRSAVDDHVRIEANVIADHRFIADNAKRADVSSGTDHGRGADDRSIVDKN
jgi:hypothetical protein